MDSLKPIFIYIHTCTYIHVYTCMYVNIDVHTCTWYVHAHFQNNLDPPSLCSDDACCDSGTLSFTTGDDSGVGALPCKR